MAGLVAGLILAASLALHVYAWLTLFLSAHYERARSGALWLIRLGEFNALGLIVVLIFGALATGRRPHIALVEAAFAGVFLVVPSAGVFFLADHKRRRNQSGAE
jgi:drug/metabolite transporter superfamily protein YnfA